MSVSPIIQNTEKNQTKMKCTISQCVLRSKYWQRYLKEELLDSTMIQRNSMLTVVLMIILTMGVMTINLLLDCHHVTGSVSVFYIHYLCKTSVR